MRLSSFIACNKEKILMEWASFTRTIETPARVKDDVVHHSHASLMLDTIIADLDKPQSAKEQRVKSLGPGPLGSTDTHAQTHGAQRLSQGFTVDQLVSEFRALRASVLQLWAASSESVQLTDPDDITRFNEAIDQALCESVARFSQDLRQNMSQLKAQCARFQTIINAIPIGLILLDEVGALVMENSEWTRIWAGNAVLNSVLDYDSFKGFRPDTGERISAEEWPCAISLKQGIHTRDVVLDIERVNGTRGSIMVSSAPIRDDAGRVIGAVALNMDITELRIAQVRLQDADRRKDEFLAVLAHELRNPLAPISMSARILLSANSTPERTRNASEVISRQVRHMTSLVDDLLDVSRVTRGLVTLDLQQLNLKTICNGPIEQARSLIESRRHTLTVRVSTEPAYVLGDPVRLVQVIANLLNNAAKYTPQGGEIVLALNVEGSLARLSISDNGLGINADFLPHVFELFTQGSRTPDRSQGGLGLGLALVKSIVELHGGHVQADSKGVGHGSTFTVLLPLGDAPVQIAEPEPQRVTLAVTKNSLRLMLVDDNKDTTDTLAEFLTSIGHQVVHHYDGQTALAHHATQAPQVFILDIGLPDMDGYKLAQHLKQREENFGAIFIALSGYGQTHDHALSKAAGFAHHIVKPLDTEDFERLLNRLGV